MSQIYTSLDSQDVRASLVLFMKNQDEFKDFDFDGAAITEQLRLLAYNTQQQAFQNNFVYNELQLDSAQLRNNVASLASRLGYIPSSPRAARMQVNVTVTPNDVTTAPTSLVMSRDTAFYATSDGSAFTFCPDMEYTANLVNGVYTFSGVTILQGTWTINAFTVQTANAFESYVIPNTNIDTSTLEVYVRTSDSSGDQNLFTQFTTAYDLGENNALFYLRENRNGFYEFKFGDGRFSKRLAYGNVITIRYVVTQGSAGNSLSNVVPSTSIGGFYNVQLTNVDAKTYGGDDEEGIESIRTLAPLMFSASDNAVTDGDYVALTKKLFSETGDAISWGGEVNDPPRYGYTFISVKPKNSATLTDLQKAALVTILSKYNIGSITPIIADPDYFFLNVATTIKYNPKLLTITTNALQSKVADYCATYSKQKMEVFNGQFDSSKFSTFLNSIDPSITGNFTQITYEKRFVPTLNFAGSYVLKFNHSLQPGTILINNFRVADGNSTTTSTYAITDDSNGTLLLKKTDGNVVTLFNGNIGTVDYVNGIISLVLFRPNSIVGNFASANASPAIGDSSVVALKNTILGIDAVNVLLKIDS